MVRILVPFVLLLVAVVGAMILDRPAPRADVVVAQVSDCFTLDPQRMSYMQDLRMARSLYEGLVRMDGRTAEILPAGAVSWTCSEDGRTWTFKLRPEARWSNGDPVVAGDYVYSWRRAIMPDTAADYSGFFYGIEGVPEFLSWRAKTTADYAAGGTHSEEAATALLEETDRRFREEVGVRAIDDHTLEVRLSNPIPYFLDLCAFAVLYPVHPPTVESFVTLNPRTGLLEQEHGWTKADTHVGNGPYRLERWRYKRDLRLERNPTYWNQDLAIADTVEVRCIQDPNTTVLAFQAGGIDWVTDLLAEYRADMADQAGRYRDRHSERLEALLESGLDLDEALAALPDPGADERRDVHVVPAFGTFFFSLNCRDRLANGRENPLRDPAVRRAMALAIDKRKLIDLVLRTGEQVADTLVPPGSIPGYDSPDGLGFDPDRAREELASAGWVDRDGDGVPENAEGEPFPTVDYLYSTGNPRYRDMGLAMRDMWSRHLGLETSLRGKDTKAYKEDLKGGDFMVARGGWYGDYGDPTTFLDLSLSTDGNNDRGFASDTFDAMLARAARERDPSVRFTMLTDAERLLMEEAMPILPIYHYATTYMYEPSRLRGITRHPRLEQNLWALEPLSDESRSAAAPPPGR